MTFSIILTNRTTIPQALNAYKSCLHSTHMAKDKPYRFSDDTSKSPVVLIGVLLVAILLVGGALLFVITMKKPIPAPPPLNITPLPPVANTTVNTTAPVCDDQCMMMQAIQQQNVSGCQAISNYSISQNCYQQ